MGLPLLILAFLIWLAWIARAGLLIARIFQIEEYEALRLIRWSSQRSWLLPRPLQAAESDGRSPQQALDPLAEVRKSGRVPFLRPDAKSQVTLRYRNGEPVGLHAVVLSTQHTPDVADAELREAVQEEILVPVLGREALAGAKVMVNPTGRFVTGGPEGDTGVTGRKIIVDTYGGSCPHGGGAFSGKDPSKVDRSAAYMGRYVAKNIVASGLATSAEIQFAYAIGYPDPVSVCINTFGTGVVSDGELEKAVAEVFSFKPAAIIKQLNLLRPIYSKTTNYGHFGKTDPDITWEKTDKVEALRKAAGKSASAVAASTLKKAEALVKSRARN